MCRNLMALLLLCLSVTALHAEVSEYVITAEQWAIPRHGERLLKLPALKRLFSQWHANSEQVIEISYPGGEQGELWVRELQDWLIALGVPSDKLRVVAGSGGKDLIKLSVLSTGGKNE